MQLKIIKFLLTLLKFKPKLHHLVILFAPLVILFRFNHFVNFSGSAISELQESSLSIGRKAHAASQPETPPTKSQTETNVEAVKKFDALTLDENQIKVIQAMAEEKSNNSNNVDIEKQKKLLEIGQKKIADQLEKLEKLKSELEKEKSTLTKEEVHNLTQTAKIYENMKPISAAEIFNKLEFVALVQIIKHMNQKKASAILAAMDPKKARYLTIELLRADQIAAPAS